MVVIKEKKIDFDFNWSKNFDENLRYETEFIIKSIESLAENKIKNEIEQLLSKTWKQYSWTPKTAKWMNHINLFLTFPKH